MQLHIAQLCNLYWHFDEVISRPEGAAYLMGVVIYSMVRPVTA